MTATGSAGLGITSNYKKTAMSTVIFLICLTSVLAHQATGFTKDAECGKTKGCYSDCTHSGCTLEVTWKADGNDHLLFSIRGKVQSGEYVAVGFSNDKKMGKDGVLACLNDGSSVIVKHTYNPSKYNEAITNGNEGLSNANNNYNNGVLSCTVRRQKAVNNAKISNLNNKFHVFLAQGPVSGGGLKKHSKAPLVSSSLQDFQATEDSTGQAKNLLVKVHGSVMVAAWVFCASIGIVMARFYKPVWSGKKLLGEKVWFTFHRMFMVLAFLCCSAGFIIIFVDVQEWSHMVSEEDYLRAHPYIGVVVMALALFNPIGALMRCHPDDKYRFIFNWGHWFIGTSAHALAILNIIFGVRLNIASLPDSLFYVTVAYAVYQVFFEICMELFDCCNGSGGRSSSYEMHDRKSGMNTYHTEAEERNGMKKFLLGLHILIITGFTAAIIILIVIN